MRMTNNTITISHIIQPFKIIIMETRLQKKKNPLDKMLCREQE